MVDLQAALASGQLSILVWVAVALGFLHTILGPDHYLPFVAMSKAGGWSNRKTWVVTLLCGFGHVLSSILIAVALIVAGRALVDWEGSSWESFHEARGSVAAWLLMGFGAAVAVWGFVRGMRGVTHAHVHVHEDGEAHFHPHDHQAEHMHAHEVAPALASEAAHEPAPEHAADAAQGGNKPLVALTPWVLFVIFVFGPCESLIPLMLAASASAGMAGSALVAGAFTLSTVATILGAVLALRFGLDLLPVARLERWSTAAAGVSLVACGACIQFLGL